MLVATGYFDKNFNPCLKITLSGAFPGPGKEFEAIIDTGFTGFTGFVSIPLMQAFPLGLPLFGTTRLTLADGSTSDRLTALGRLTLLGQQTKEGIVILEQSSTEVLVGMGFLRAFELALVITKDAITVFDEEVLNQLKQQAAKQQAPAPAQPAQNPADTLPKPSPPKT